MKYDFQISKHSYVKKYKAALYIRLSAEDMKRGESNSVTNQRTILNDYIAKHDDLVIYSEYVDDGYSGTTFDRPGFKRMMEDIENKKVDTIIVKDLSRFGRNYIEVGSYLEYKFPELDIRFISILDDIDSVEKPDSINSMIVPFKNLMNEEYARDISNKIKSAIYARRNKGDYICSSVPYGYIRDSENKYKLVIDSDAAKVVKYIFDLALNHTTSTFIAKKLNDLGIYTPSQYKVKVLGKKYRNLFVNELNIDEKKWTSGTIAGILQNRVYCGDVIQGKFATMSFKNHHIKRINEDKWIIHENVHESIISRDVFDRVNLLYFSKIVKANSKGSFALFAGFVRCSDCYRGLNRVGYRYSGKKKATSHYSYVCGTYLQISKTKCTPHKIRENELKEIVLKAIRNHVRLVIKLDTIVKNKTIEKKQHYDKDIIENNISILTDELNQNLIFKRNLYMDWKNKIISEDDYKEFSSNYERKIKEINEKIDNCKSELSNINNTYKFDWISTVKKYKNIKDINRDVLFDLINEIIIYEDKRVDIKFLYDDIYNETLSYFSNKG